MSWTALSSERAFEEGSSLWIVPELNFSSWAKQINWYLNFQLRSAKEHQTKPLPKELLAVIETWEVATPKPPLSNSAPLLIESSKLLPNQMTVQLTEANFESWLKSAMRVWNDLNRPSVRVFLPAPKSGNDLISKWDLPEEVQGSYVVD